MSNFHKFKASVALQFAVLSQHPLYRVDVTGDQLWHRYIQSYPAGSNPIFRERTEHDCSCCKQFIRTIGNVVAIIDGRIVTIWDGPTGDPAYDVVAAEMMAYVKQFPIVEPFLHYEKTVGTDKNFEQRVGQETATWQHFHVNVPTKFIEPKKDIPTILGELRTRFETLRRALVEIKIEAIDTVLELIDQGSLYRGEEHKYVLTTFKTAKKSFDRTPLDRRATYVWQLLDGGTASVSGIRNSVIGTLLVDLSEGKDLEAAVKSFEVKVAPTNYKRPTALVTPTMIAKAKETLSELGLLSALDRRYASITDIKVDNLLFADRGAKKVREDVFDDIRATKAAKPKLDKVESITIDDFIKGVLPKIETMEVMLETKHRGNLVSLIAPSDPTAGQLFKWSNNFSWAYNGDVADSIKERVKAAGGNVTGDLCCRLAWDYTDDLDFHMEEPDGSHIFFRQFRRANSPSGGQLDLDANGADGPRPNPAENIFYASRARMKEGKYKLWVNQWAQRQRDAKGFDAEIDFLGAVSTFHYDKTLRNGENVTVAEFTYSHARGIEFAYSLPRGTSNKEMWALPTNQFQKVKLMMLSPNYWVDRGVGNKHFFFILDGAKREDEARGFFNEFLHSAFDKHRKVFEIVGGKMKATEGAEDQLSGLGFSSTKPDEIIVRVTGSFTRTLRITF